MSDKIVLLSHDIVVRRSQEDEVVQDTSNRSVCQCSTGVEDNFLNVVVEEENTMTFLLILLHEVERMSPVKRKMRCRRLVVVACDNSLKLVEIFPKGV